MWTLFYSWIEVFSVSYYTFSFFHCLDKQCFWWDFRVTKTAFAWKKQFRGKCFLIKRSILFWNIEDIYLLLVVFVIFSLFLFFAFYSYMDVLISSIQIFLRLLFVLTFPKMNILISFLVNALSLKLSTEDLISSNRTSYNRQDPCGLIYYQPLTFLVKSRMGRP